MYYNNLPSLQSGLWLCAGILFICVHVHGPKGVCVGQKTTLGVLLRCIIYLV